MMFHGMPQFFNAVEFGTIGRQEIKRELLFRYVFDKVLDFFRGMNRGVIEDDDQRLAHFVFYPIQKTRKNISS